MKRVHGLGVVVLEGPSFVASVFWAKVGDWGFGLPFCFSRFGARCGVCFWVSVLVVQGLGLGMWCVVKSLVGLSLFLLCFPCAA